MSYRLSFDHPFQGTDKYDLPRKIDLPHDLPRRRKEPFPLLTVNHKHIVGARFQDLHDPS